MTITWENGASQAYGSSYYDIVYCNTGFVDSCQLSGNDTSCAACTFTDMTANAPTGAPSYLSTTRTTTPSAIQLPTNNLSQEPWPTGASSNYTYPSIDPSINPTINPTIIPTIRIHPSCAPSMGPTDLSPKDQTINATMTLIDIKSPTVFNNTVLLAIIVTIAVLLFVCMISLFFCCHKRLQNEKRRKELEMKQILQRSLSALALKKLESNSSPTGQENKHNEQYDNNIDGHFRARSIDLQRSSSGNYGEGNYNDIYDEDEGDNGNVNLDTEVTFSIDGDRELDNVTGTQFPK